MEKIIDLNENVHEICEKFPEAKKILSDFGFKEIMNPILFNTAARITTLPKAAETKKINLEDLKAKFRENGFEFAEDEKKLTKEEREELLQSYVERLSNGENLDSVRKDFVENFSNVEGIEIANAEQKLLQGGVPLEKVQKLCDVHSALFHGATTEEKIAAAEEDVARSAERQENQNAVENSANQNSSSKAQNLENEKGHPLNVLAAENSAIQSKITEMKNSLKDVPEDFGKEQTKKIENLIENLQNLRQVARHYSKKGDLLYPILSQNYEITGPSDVMWKVDDEIRDEIGKLAKFDAKELDEAKSKDFRTRLEAVLTRAEEMIYKEQNILFPICADKFSDSEWISIAKEIKTYSPCLIEKIPEWQKLADESENENETTKFSKADAENIFGSEVKFPTGHLKLNQLAALLNTIPLEITFVDEKDINRYFNDGAEKLLKRPLLALDREVYSCHPKFIKPIVKGIIDSFRAGRKDFVERWITKEGVPLYIIYAAVRDKEGNFLGTLECVQNMEFARKHFLKK